MASQAKEDATTEHSWVPRTQLSEAEAETTGAVGRLLRVGQLQAGQTVELGREGARYEIVRQLGKGGMAEVFLARRLGAAGFVREVALKCIMTGLDVDERIRRAFLYEAQLGSRLRHPNIAEADDLAQVGDRYYLVLEYIEGVTAKNLLQTVRRQRKQLSEEFCCHVAASVAEGLHYVHGRADRDGRPLGIVHRDVTAANVMIASSGVVKLLDFGIAYARMQGRDTTRTGTLKGTYAYFSPEQASGGLLDGRSDLFSLGILFVELLTGVRVFDDESDIVTGRKISECARADVRAATGKLPRSLREICERALAKAPADRFQDGAAYARALRGYVFERGLTYSPSECAAEALALGAFATRSWNGVSHGAFGSQAAGTSISAEEDTSLPRVAEQLRKPGGGRRGLTRWWVPAAAIVAVGGLLTARATFWRSGTSERVAAEAPGTAAPPPVVVREEEASGAPMSPPTQSEAVLAPPTSPTVDGLVVRPKRGRQRESGLGATAGGKVQDERRRDGARSITTEFVDRRSVASASSTLERGTLIPAKLVRPIDPMAPGEAEAVATEDVVREGVVLVPRGSTIACSSRASKDERVGLSCDSIKTADRLLLFSGLVVGEGQHVGLRVLDRVVPTGTSFVIFVNASAAVR